jgi:hypothetical protein
LYLLARATSQWPASGRPRDQTGGGRFVQLSPALSLSKSGRADSTGVFVFSFVIFVPS